MYFLISYVISNEPENVNCRMESFGIVINGFYEEKKKEDSEGDGICWVVCIS